jgi:photosystem II stability/assembly factor-like uncharacterized protein
MNPMRPAIAFWLLLATSISAGCLSSPPSVSQGAQDVEPLAVASWAVPSKLNDKGFGYEPSIVADGFGRLYAMAHKGRTAQEGDRLASWLWYSEDGGKTWKDLPSPAQFHEKLAGIEGDLAVDADNRVYFVDTYLMDNTISVWRATKERVAWESSRSVQLTTGLDDRPWLVAQGSGVLYYLGDHIVSDIPSPEGLTAAKTGGSRWWFYRSMDAGLTWSPGMALGDIGVDVRSPRGPVTGGMCGLDAGATMGLVAVVCVTEDGKDAFLLRSQDYGKSWQRLALGKLQTAPAFLFPSVAVQRDGRIVAAWIDDDYKDNTSGRLNMALVDGAQVSVLDVTPREGSLAHVWLAVNGQDELVLNYELAPEVQAANRTWRMHALTARVGAAKLEGMQHTLVDPEPISKNSVSVGHFIQNVFDARGVPHVAYQRDIGFFPQEYRADILVARPLGLTEART